MDGTEPPNEHKQPQDFSEVKQETKTEFMKLVEGLTALSPVALTDEDGEDLEGVAVLHGPWLLDDGRKLLVYVNTGDNHTSSHEVILTETTTNPDGVNIEIDEVFGVDFSGKWSKQTYPHDRVEQGLIELQTPSPEVSFLNPDPTQEALAAEEERQVALLSVDMARADEEGFGLQDLDDASVVEVNRLMSEVLSGLERKS